jgi:hypothetical protein
MPAKKIYAANETVREEFSRDVAKGGIRKLSRKAASTSKGDSK